MKLPTPQEAEIASLTRQREEIAFIASRILETVAYLLKKGYHHESFWPYTKEYEPQGYSKDLVVQALPLVNDEIEESGWKVEIRGIWVFSSLHLVPLNG